MRNLECPKEWSQGFLKCFLFDNIFKCCRKCCYRSNFQHDCHLRSKVIVSDLFTNPKKFMQAKFRVDVLKMFSSYGPYHVVTDNVSQRETPVLKANVKE